MPLIENSFVDINQQQNKLAATCKMQILSILEQQ